MRWLLAIFAVVMFVAAMAATIAGAQDEDPSYVYAALFYVATGLSFLGIAQALREDKKL